MKGEGTNEHLHTIYAINVKLNLSKTNYFYKILRIIQIVYKCYDL
jgi:hypothetical protein